ncbi:MAG: hypothetical protein WC700_18280, partial [Gemmatimonadaceae bacterium]
MFGAFDDTAEQVFARRRAAYAEPERYTGDADIIMDRSQEPLYVPHARPARRARAASMSHAGKPPSKKKRLLAMKKMVRAGIHVGRCGEALNHWRSLASSGLPGAKKAARQLKKTFANKC